uniref:Cytochrome P450 monooxygenase notG' n=1 Tax=Aspergillus versicolor TaxID=46472 RepID=NOTG_ASPVE|nr:RecName: Full=Cytochrome P450 monooxygenase notG'; AltName: Full=Notoamide biosynthesis cluster protein G'; Flags: Precursor [Aspergillus versicolor]AGC83578.1 P450 monooxygenase [Aspergillus versicolor]
MELPFSAMSLLYLLVGIAGVISHQCYFRRGEHHLYPFAYLRWYTLIITAPTVVVSIVWGLPLYDAAKATGGWALTYFAGLYTSLLLYRVQFHPLHGFPGPYGARISGLWLSMGLRDRPAFQKLQELHNQYGPIVRVGPSELSIAYPEAVGIVYGHQSRCYKSTFYDNGHPMKSLHSYRDRAAHDQRRRTWSTGFGDRALRGYETRVHEYRQKLFTRLNDAVGLTVNISDWFNFYSYDVMGDLAFGRSFNMLDTHSNHWAIQVLLDGIVLYKYFVPSWLFRCFVTLPSLSKNWHRFVEFTTQKLVHRMNDKLEIPDICASLLAPLNGRSPTPDEFNLLMGDAMLVVTAGSDTTATALTSVVYELARHPEDVERLRAELLPIDADANGEYRHEQISNLPHLNGFINETLRLHPPVPSVIPRITPAEGVHVKGTHIPGGMAVFCPQWVIGRSDAAFIAPLSFNPERWYKHPDLIKHRSAYAPFLTGPYSCIGKPLALMNIRTTIARLIMTFEIRFPAGEDGSHLMENVEDHFSMGIERMPVVLTRRG